MNQGDLAGVWAVFTPLCRRAGRPGVRADIVAMEAGSSGVVKGRRAGDGGRKRCRIGGRGEWRGLTDAEFVTLEEQQVIGTAPLGAGG